MATKKEKNKKTSKIHELFGASKKYETEGVWLEYAEAGRILIARAGGSNEKYAKMLTKKMKPYRRALKAGTISDTIAKKILAEVFAKTVVLDWKGITDKNGQDIEFNDEACVKLFTELPDLFRDVQEQADNFSLFKEEIDEEDAKN